MKVRFCSDLHLELNPIPKFEKPDPDEILLVAGDTIVADFLARATDPSSLDPMVKEMRGQFKLFLILANFYQQVYLISGNHEHYNGAIGLTHDRLVDACSEYNKIKVLENEYALLPNNTVLLGCTLWTDMQRDNPLTHLMVGDTMNDFRVIQNTRRRFTTHDAHALHLSSLSYLSEAYHYHTYDFEKREPDKKTNVIIMTHHAPSARSDNPVRHTTQLDYGYFSDLEDFILDRPQIIAWIHGHTHHPVDYKIGNCRVVSNPRGYGIKGCKDPCFDDFSLDPFIEVADEKT